MVFHSQTKPPGNLSDSCPSSLRRFCSILAGRSTKDSSASAAGTRRTRKPSTSESNTRQKTCQSTLRVMDQWRGRRGFPAGSCTLPKTRSRRYVSFLASRYEEHCNHIIRLCTEYLFHKIPSPCNWSLPKKTESTGYSHSTFGRR